MSDTRLTVQTPEGVTDAYAEASGDRNPIHLDEAFATSVGLPGRILHGLWTAAQVARAAGQVGAHGPLRATPDGVRYALESLSVQFRGMGQIGPDVEVSASARAAAEGGVEVRLEANQAGVRLIRNARARLRAG